MKYHSLGNIGAGQRLIDLPAFSALGIHIEAPCGGKGRCGKCRAYIGGAVLPPDDSERRMLTEAELAAGVRLVCRCVSSGGEITAAEYKLEREAQIQLEGVMGAFEPSPVRGGFGVAVDIGTTTVAVYLCDLDACRVTSAGAFQNPQRIHGADVINRIGFVMEDKANLGVLRKMIVDAINAEIGRFGIPPALIKAAAVTGNTTMLHMFANYDPSGIANAPFTPSTLFGFPVKAAETGLNINPDADVYLMPCFSAYVGGDIASGMIAAGVDKSAGLNLFIDIGTNGEMGLGGSEGICLCATAAGPAFEGAHIECGMGGVVGAIRRVSQKNGGLSVEVIGGGKPEGICGSGLIDAIAVMLEAGIIDETGRLDAALCPDGRFYFDENKNVYISGKDIREVQLAKAAVCAGIMTLFDEAGAEPSDAARVIIAGGFGAHIDPHSAAVIGLIPAELESKVEIAGNTAGTGSALYLFSADARRRIAEIPALSRYLELSASAVFMDEYIDKMTF